MVTQTRSELTSLDTYRLVNSKFPPESLFDDVADLDEFEAIYAIQALTNPRLLNEVGDLNLLPNEEIPFGIEGVNYVTAPFTHANPDGSRFSDGTFGMLYLAENMDTAIAETRYHQEKHFNNIKGLHYDTITMRGIKVCLSGEVVDHTSNELIHIPHDYSASRVLGTQLLKAKELGIQYNSVRNHGFLCWGLFTPKTIHSAIQTKHFEFIYDGSQISTVRQISMV